MRKNSESAGSVVVVGSSGMLGVDITTSFSEKPGLKTIPLNRQDLDIRDRDATFSILSGVKPAVVILSAAYTKVDDCEVNRQMAFDVNAEGAGNVAAACAENGAFMLYVSTDYVFDGNKDGKYTEEDVVSPLNVYGESKLQGEQCVRELLDAYCIVRTSWLFGAGGPNFVKSILNASRKTRELTVVDDQKGSPTYTRDLAIAIYTLISKKVRGVVNVTNSGACTWFDFAENIISTFGVSGVNISPVKTSASGRAALRPACSVLDCSRYESVSGVKMRSWQDALGACAREMNEEVTGGGTL